LPETACNSETLEALIEENVKYTILDPSQAQFIRKINYESDTEDETSSIEIENIEWTDVSTGNIDTRISYRYYSEAEEEKFIDIIFYDGPLSKNIAFDDHIYSADKLFNRIKQVPLNESDENNLISVAVDGETFGHHKRYTERTLSYLFSEILPSSDYENVNFGNYLSENEPLFEVKVKDGDDGNGTSWSCQHGVGRWKENCGCGRTDEYPSQEWRKPLRESLNFLRDEHALLFESAGSQFLNNVWDARNDYINLVFEESYETYLENRKRFFKKHSKKKLTEEEKDLCIKLLEMEKFSMLMFTSCGWFFSDISGIETLQILEYAARSMEISREITGIDIEKIFLEKLSVAKSNKEEFADGKDLYLKKVKINAN
ncbi:MAG TPA: DUF3536 domain-containing protein, partial [Ignavibacteria bacterium]|nr:DUF3536 domain-containing protein [Ignavibacteria bacterium]